MWHLALNGSTLEARGPYIKTLRAFPNIAEAEAALAALERDIADRVEEMLDAYLEQDNEIN